MENHAQSVKVAVSLMSDPFRNTRPPQVYPPFLSCDHRQLNSFPVSGTVGGKSSCMGER